MGACCERVRYCRTRVGLKASGVIEFTYCGGRKGQHCGCHREMGKCLNFVSVIYREGVLAVKGCVEDMKGKLETSQSRVVCGCYVHSAKATRLSQSFS